VALLWTRSNSSVSFFVLRAPELDTGLQMGSHKSGVKGQNHLPRPAGHASLDAAQDRVGLLGCERTLLDHIDLLVNQHPQVLLLRATLNMLITQPLARYKLVVLIIVQKPP